jgi:hypothetical protein
VADDKAGAGHGGMGGKGSVADSGGGHTCHNVANATLIYLPSILEDTLATMLMMPIKVALATLWQVCPPVLMVSILRWH